MSPNVHATHSQSSDRPYREPFGADNPLSSCLGVCGLGDCFISAGSLLNPIKQHFKCKYLQSCRLKYCEVSCNWYLVLRW